MTDKLMILGAGVDRTRGIEFPLANTLLADIAEYIEGPGSEVDQALRDMIPGLRFSFNKMIARAVDKIATRETNEQRTMVKRVQEVIEDLPPEQEHIRKHGELIVRLFDKLAAIAEQSYIDDETEKLIREVFPKDAEDWIDSDSVLDIHKLSLSDTFKTVLKRTLKMGLSGEHHAVADALGAEMLNIETLLIEKFLGFYNEKMPDIKNYLYISWVLWAFLVDRQKEVFSNHIGDQLPFYGQLPSGIRAITLNYTSFLEEQLGDENVNYFHGGLSEYVRMDTRDVLAIEKILECEPADFIREIVAPNVDLTNDEIRLNRHVIPALVPPLRLKPILSHKYIDLWARAAQWIESAKHIVVVGYSFNNADEHFNDIMRCHTDCAFDIVAPDATSDQFKHRMEKVFNTPENQFNTVTVQDHRALQARNLRLIPVEATDVDISALYQDGRRA